MLCFCQSIRSGAAVGTVMAMQVVMEAVGDDAVD